MSYPLQYDEAWNAMLQKPWAHGLAPIHHGCFESGWTGALEAAARLADPPAEDSMATDEDLAVYAALGKVAAAIRALAVWTERRPFIVTIYSTQSIFEPRKRTHYRARCDEHMWESETRTRRESALRLLQQHCLNEHDRSST